jgi:flagellar hook protein FlgE
LDDWKKKSKIEYTYNNNNRTLQFVYLWRSKLNDWGISDKTEYTYDKKGNKIFEVGYDWLNEWKENRKEVTFYDRKGNKTLHIAYFWDKAQNIWDPFSKEEYICDSNQTLQINYFWDKAQNTWKIYCKLESTYDNNGNQALYSQYNWSTKEDKWIQIHTITYYYSLVSIQNSSLKFHVFSGTMFFYNNFVLLQKNDNNT